jgi:hypothetical protein
MQQFEKIVDVCDSLVLADGRRIFLNELHQSHTYSSILEGRPTSEVNNRLIQAAITEATESFNAPVKLIPPERVAGTRGSERIPAITSLGLFTSTEPVRNSRGTGSMLGLVWFQTEFGLPTSGSFFSAIESIEWEREAEDFDR